MTLFRRLLWVIAAIVIAVTAGCVVSGWDRQAMVDEVVRRLTFHQ